MEAIHEYCRGEIAEAKADIERTTSVWGLTGTGSVERRIRCANRTGEIRALKHLIDVEFIEDTPEAMELSPRFISAQHAYDNDNGAEVILRIDRMREQAMDEEQDE